MILRTITLAGGIAGAAATSQFPEFSQQYMQRLGGAVDELAVITADFDASAAKAGVTRQQALDELQGSTFLNSHQGDVKRSFVRYERLQNDLKALQGHGPFMRAYHLPRLTDPDIAKAAWGVYQPAVPLNFAGISFAVVGFLIAGLGIGMIGRMIAWPFRRRQTA